MKERMPIQKEIGHVERVGKRIIIKSLRIDEKEPETDEQIGEITLNDREKPIPHFMARLLHVRRTERGKGFGSQLLDEVERMSKETNKPVVLGNGISSGSQASRMYSERTGWREIPSFAHTTMNGYVYAADPRDSQLLYDFYNTSRESKLEK